MSDLPVVRSGLVPAAELTDALSSAANYARAEKSDATRRAYRADFAHFSAFCLQARASPIPAAIATVAAYLASLADAGLRASTISRRKAAIGYAHRLQGQDSPTNAEPVKAVLRGIRRRIGVAVERKAPATAPALRRMLKRIPDTITGKRDRALLLIGFAAALRRSELVGLDIADLEMHDSGLVVHIGRSKTDQEGEGQAIAVPRGKKLMPVEALEAWIAVLDRKTGPVFVPIGKGGRVKPERLSDKSVADIVKRYARLAKLDPMLFAGHSLRAGFVTSALETGADVLKVMDVTRHKSVDTLKGYDRRAKAFRDHAGKGFL